MKRQTALTADNPEASFLDLSSQDIARLRDELKAVLDSHRQFGELGPEAASNTALRIAQKLLRRSLTWYTKPNQLFQGAVIRALEDITSAVEHQQQAAVSTDDKLNAALSTWEECVRGMHGDLPAIRQQLGLLRWQLADVDGQQAVPGAGGVDRELEIAPWGTPFSDNATESDILSCFRLLLGRRPRKEEWPGHVLHVGEDLTHLVASYLNSEEFQNRHLISSQLDQWQLVELPPFKICVPTEDTFIGKEIIRAHDYEPHVGKVFREYLQPGMTVLDIGANVGYFSLMAASLVGPSGIVYSWEPSPANARALFASQLANGFKNIEIIQAAAADRTALLRYYRASSNGNVAEVTAESPEDVLSAETVPALRIDDVIPENVRIDFVKIDVEGYEFKAVSGALSTLQRSRPIVVSEFAPASLQHYSGVSGRDYLEFFASQGYDMFVIADSGTIAADIARVLSLFEASGSDHIDVLLRPKESSAPPGEVAGRAFSPESA